MTFVVAIQVLVMSYDVMQKITNYIYIIIVLVFFFFLLIEASFIRGTYELFNYLLALITAEWTFDSLFSS